MLRAPCTGPRGVKDQLRRVAGQFENVYLYPRPDRPRNLLDFQLTGYPMNTNVRIAQPADLPKALAAYRAWNYQGGVGSDDTVWLAEFAGESIGVVRVAPEEGTLVLRGMRVAERWRRQGIGSQILRAVAEWLGNRECYCVPYVHLIEFYNQVGFSEIEPSLAPAFLFRRVTEYKAKRSM
jgi:GNAT superfamily N-acetyltransferase